jgi:hypothetical protein
MLSFHDVENFLNQLPSELRYFFCDIHLSTLSFE